MPSIRKYGLLTSFARQGRRAVWVHVARLDKWADTHVRMRHAAENESIVHITVDVPRSWLRRHASGIYYCMQDIPPSRFVSARVVRVTVEEIAL